MGYGLGSVRVAYIEKIPGTTLKNPPRNIQEQCSGWTVSSFTGIFGVLDTFMPLTPPLGSIRNPEVSPGFCGSGWSWLAIARRWQSTQRPWLVDTYVHHSQRVILTKASHGVRRCEPNEGVCVLRPDRRFDGGAGEVHLGAPRHEDAWSTDTLGTRSRRSRSLRKPIKGRSENDLGECPHWVGCSPLVLG